MENRESFFARLEPRLAPSELLNVQIAYSFAKFLHRSQERKELDSNGQNVRYFEHVRRTAIIVMDEFHIHKPSMIITALMHDSLEDCKDITAPMLEHMFGTEVARSVRLLTKDLKEGYYDRLFNGNIEAITVKVADRIDNLRSMQNCTKEFIQKQIKETRDHIIPGLYGAQSSYIYFLNTEINELERSLK